MSILKTEYSEDEFAEVTYKDGYEDGVVKGAMKEKGDTVKRFAKMGLSLDQIAQGTNLTLKQVKEILELPNNK